MFQKIFFLLLAGAVGTGARYGLSGLVQRNSTTVWFPWSTLAINISGCFVAGLLWTLFEERWLIPPEVRTVILVGFMGAFTTFSSYILESCLMLRAADWLGASVYMLLQNAVGIAALLSGMFAARLI